MEFTALVTIAALIEYGVFSLLVAAARARTGVKAPAITGHPEFERYFRVQQNTLERLIIFIPSLWIYSYYNGQKVAALLGMVFILARAAYCAVYVRAPDKRSLTFGVGEIANTALMVGAVIGAVRSML
jgi:glutathione S-transferase